MPRGLLLFRSQRREIVPEVPALGLDARTAIGSTAIFFSFDEPIELVCGTFSTGLQVLTPAGGLRASLSSKFGFCELKWGESQVSFVILSQGEKKVTYLFRRGLQVRIVHRLRALADCRGKPSKTLGQCAHGVFLEIIKGLVPASKSSKR